MTAFWILMALTAVAAVVDWRAVGASDHRLEYLAKPSVLVALTAAAAVIPAHLIVLDDRRWFFVAALTCCLIGDVALMLPRDLFVPGLAAFLVGHILYIVGLLRPPSPPGVPPFAFSTVGLVVAAGTVAVVALGPATLVIRSLLAQGRAELVAPVCLYLAAIATMVVLATNVGTAAAAVGGVLFLVSDTLLALNRFVRPLPGGSVAVHVTYHLAQGLLVLSLLR